MNKPRVRVYPKMAYQSGYDGATMGRRSANWYAPASGPNSVLLGNLSTLRNRSRAAYRNNPWLNLGLERGVSNEVGTGIVPRFRSKDEEFKEKFRVLFNHFSESCDPSGNINFYGIQAQACRARRVSAECFIRRRRRSASSNLPLPLQIQVLESEYVPVDLNETRQNGNIIYGGIEFNRRGQRVAYWMYPEHPEDQAFNVFSGRYIRVPARDVIHHYNPIRPGQIRGEPDAVQSLLKAHTFDSYDDAELVRKQTRAPFTGFLTRESFDESDWLYDPFSGLPRKDGDVPALDAQPGSILTGLPGEKLTLFNGDDTGAGYADFMRQQLLGQAAGLGVPYELITGDWSKVNDRLYRAMINEFRRNIEMLQDHLMIFQLCRTVKDWAIETAVLSGKINAPGYADNYRDYHKTDWQPQAWRHIHPEQDVNAVTKAIEANLTSRDAEIAKLNGYDAEEVDEQIVEGQHRIDRLKTEKGLDINMDGNIQNMAVQLVTALSNQIREEV